MRNTWRIINELTSRKSKSTFVNEVMLNNGNSIRDPLELSEAFNDHFSNIGPRLANEILVNKNCPSYVDYLRGTCDRHVKSASRACEVHPIGVIKIPSILFFRRSSVLQAIYFNFEHP